MNKNAGVVESFATMNPRQQQQQQQQHVPMATDMMPPTTLNGNVPVQYGTLIPTAAGFVTVQMSAARDPGIAEMYQSRQSKGLGITLVSLGVVAIILNGVLFAVNDSLAPIGHGFWCGPVVRCFIRIIIIVIIIITILLAK